MCNENSCCQKPEQLKGKPRECAPKQIEECHGSSKNHPCVTKNKTETFTKKFDFACMASHEYEQREKNVFYETREFKMRIIDLAPGQGMPRCDMKSHVVFVCIEGEAEVSVGIHNVSISRGQGLVTEPATISMQTKAGARILGIQIHGERKEK